MPALSEPSAASLRAYTLAAGARLLLVVAVVPRALPQDEAPAPSTFEERLAGARAFQELVFHDPLTDHAPFTIYAQEKPGESGDPAKAAAALWGAVLDRTDRALRELYLEPLGLTPREGFERTPLIVLGTQADYASYLTSRSSPGRHTQEASDFDADLGAAVTYGSASLAPVQLYAILHDLVLGRLAAVAEQPLAELWIYDGLASYVSNNLGGRFGSTDARPHGPFLLSLHELWSDEAAAAQYWLHPRELLAVRGEEGLRALPRAKQGAKPGAGSLPYARYQFEAQSWLLVHWAHTTQEGSRRRAFLDYLDLALDGRGGGAKLVESMGLSDLDELERELRRHGARLYEEELRRELSLGSGTGPDDPAARRERALAEARAALAEGPEDDVELLALALWLARTGRLAGAVEELARAGEARDADARARLERGRERITALLEAREAAFARIAEEGGRLRLAVGGDRKTSRRVRAYEGGVLTLGRSEADLTTLAAEDVPTEEWITALGKRTSEFGPEWLRGYALLLAGNRNAGRLLEAAGPEAEAICDDAERDFARLVALGRAQATLRELAGRPIPGDGSAAGATVETIRALVAEAGDLAPVARGKEALRTCARAALGVLFAAEGLDEVLGAAVEGLGDGRVRLTYDFEDVEEARDFLDDHDYLLQEHERLAGHEKSAGAARPEATWGVRNGSMGGAGWVCFRHVLEFEGPMRLKARVWFATPPEGITYAPELMLGVCDDGAGDFVALRSALADLYVFDGDSRTLHTADGELLTMEVDYELELRHDGKTATTFSDGRKMQEGEVGRRTSGAVFLWSHSYSPACIRELLVEGRPAAPSLERLGEAWITDRLAALGL